MAARESKKNAFETRLERLQEIVVALERGDLPLDQGMALYREGVECARLCRRRLEEARHEVRLWRNGEEVVFDAEAARPHDGTAREGDDGK